MINSIEYRRAFQNYVTKGEAIPSEFKNAVTTTKEIGTVIPEVVLQRILEKLEVNGQLLQLITRTSYKGGVSIPTSNLKPVATWVAENAISDIQNKPTGNITFGYFKLRCAIGNSLEVETVSMDMFERIFVSQVVEAMTKALEKAIISGAGSQSNQPTGILVEENLDATRNVEVAANKAVNYQTLIEAEGKLELAYESGAVYVMTKKQFMEFAGMQDSAGQPIARTNYGITGAPERTLLGRRVVLVEGEYMPTTLSTKLAGTVVAFLFNMKDYVLNTNLNMTIKKYEDHTNDSFVTKAILLADGKVIDKNSLVTITKK